MMRSSCGSNDHPDSQTFLQLYWLFSTYSLVKPPKGSCTDCSEILSTLLNINDVKVKEVSRKEKWHTFLDLIIEEDSTEELLPKTLEMAEDHSYQMVASSDFITSYVSGYILRRTSKFTTCDICLQNLTTPDANGEEANKFIELKSRKCLLYPSQAIVQLITSLENHLLLTLLENKIHSEFLYDVMQRIYHGPSLNLVGCDQHKSEVTEKIVQFYLILRLHFICKQISRNESTQKTKKFRKLSKLWCCKILQRML